MPRIHTLRCRCGQLRGSVDLSGLTNRCVCYCSDCQAFVRHIGANDALDGQGGTDIVQVRPLKLTFTQGAENLACIRLTDKGMLRWYSACCRTPVGNTPADWRVSFVGLIHSCLDREGPPLDESFGPVSMRVGVKSALGDSKPAASGLLSGVARAVAMIVSGRLGGAYRVSPFFDRQTGLPIAKPVVLSARELAAAKGAA